MTDVHQVEGLSEAEGLALLRNSPAMSDVGDRELAALVVQCGGLPLLLDQAAGYIARTRMPVGKYATLLRADPTDTLTRTSGTPTDAGAGTGGQLIESVRASLDSVGADARTLLAMLANLAREPVHLESLADLDSPYPDTDDNGAAEDDPSTTTDAWGGRWDPIRFEDAIGGLRDFSLVQRDETLVHAHDLVLDVAADTLSETELRVGLLQAHILVLELLPDRPALSSQWPAMARLQPHILAVIETALIRPDVCPPEATGRLIDRVAMYLAARGDYEAADKLFTAGLDLLRSLDLAANSMHGSLLHNYAILLSDRGDLEEAERLHRQALAVKEAACGPNHLIVGVSCGALGAVLDSQDRWEEAEPFYERAATIYDQLGNDEWVANALIDLAAVALRRDQSDRAEQLLGRAIDAADRGHAPAEAVLARLRLATLRHAAGDTPTAARLCARARRVAKHFEAPVQYVNATLAHAGYLMALQLESSAAALSNQAAAIAEGLFAQNPVDLAKILGTYGSHLVELGRPDRGIEYLIRSQSLLEAHLPASSDTVARSRLMTAGAHVQMLAPAKATIVCETLVRDAERATPLVSEAENLLAWIRDGPFGTPPQP